MGIDLGIDNLIAAAWNSNQPPLVLNGRPLKSMNQYYNKRKARLQEEAKSANGLDMIRYKAALKGIEVKVVEVTRIKAA